MRQSTTLLVLASLVGAITGAFAAWQLSTIHDPRTRVRLEPPTHPSQPIADDSRTRTPPLHPGMTSIPVISAQVVTGSAISATLVASVPPQSAPSTVPERSSAPAAISSGIPEATASTEERAFASVAWVAATDPIMSEQGCLKGVAIDCLRLADLEASRGSHAGNQKGQMYRERAYSMLVLQCKRRTPDACVAIARMHALGFDVLRDPKSREALISRARDLCKHHTGNVCSALGS